jgi:hypothetical protein
MRVGTHARCSLPTINLIDFARIVAEGFANSLSSSAKLRSRFRAGKVTHKRTLEFLF